MITATNVVGGGKGSFAIIIVNAHEGVSLSVKKDTTIINAGDTSGSWAFSIPSAGIWEVKATHGTDVRTQNVSITTEGQIETVSFAFVFGIRRLINSTSTTWERTDEAIGFTATASSGTSSAGAGHSDFGDQNTVGYLPWNGMVREQLSTGDVTVRIPKFYFRRYLEDGYEWIKIAATQFQGFSLHPAFQHNGTVQDHINVGAFVLNSAYKSLPGQTPLTGVYLDGLMDGLRNAKGDDTNLHWGIVDVWVHSAIQMLILVEFANNDVQSVIGQGYVASTHSGKTGTGTCESVPNLTGSVNKNSQDYNVIYRGIEGLWGNVWEYMGNIVYGQYVDEDHTYQGYNVITYMDNWPTVDWSVGHHYAVNRDGMNLASSNSWIGSLTYDEDHPEVMLPKASVSSGSSSTYYADTSYAYGFWQAPVYGGMWKEGSGAGIFEVSMMNMGASGILNQISARMLYIPPEE